MWSPAVPFRCAKGDAERSERRGMPGAERRPCTDVGIDVDLRVTVTLAIVRITASPRILIRKRNRGIPTPLVCNTNYFALQCE